MKRLFLLVVIVAMLLPSCKKINEAIDGLDSRLDKLEQETIPTIDEQISAINTTLSNLDAMDKELKGYIDNLTTTASSLQEQINATNTKIDEVKKALQKEIEDSNAENLAQLQTAKSEVLAQLEAAKTELENELKQINITIETLKEKDKELDNKIAELRSYVDNELGETTDWVNATFATLEQYNSLVTEIAVIKEQIKAINQSISELETRLTTKINEDIATAVSTLNADIQQKVKDITDAYTNAIKSAKEEITSAYTTAIQTAITTLDNSLKTWVGEQLSNYYTIAEVNAKISALQTAITDGDATLQEELKSLKSQLETTATEITAAYKKAIEKAINTNNGVIDTKIANEIASVNQRITNEVATINAKIAEIESRLDNVEAKIAELLARIQSVSYIPTYDDGKATLKWFDNISQVTLDFEISPKDAVVGLAKVWQSAVSVKAIYTQTRAVEFIDLPITKFETDATNGVITLTASGENLLAELFSGTQSASVRLSISDGCTSVVSDYIPMVAKEITNEIWYTSSNGNVVTPYATDAFGANIVSNTYENGKGVIKFDGDVTSIGDSAFLDCTSLTSVTIGNSVTSIGGHAFYKCTSLTSVTIGNSVTSIGDYAFHGCTLLTSVTIPDSVTSIGDYAFSGCSSLKRVDISDLSAWCKISFDSYGANPLCNGAKLYLNGSELTNMTIPSDITSIGDQAFYNCTSLTSVTIPDSVTSIGYEAFYDCTSLKRVDISDLSAWCKIGFGGSYANPLCNGAKLYLNGSELTDITIPSDITEIKNYAFYKCTSLTSITIPNSVTSIGEGAFRGCSSLTRIDISDLSAWCKIGFGDGANPLRNGAKLYLNGSELTDITIPSDITEIKADAFAGCTSLTSITIPDRVTSIGYVAFSHCTSLTSITIPDSVTSIGERAFYYCSSLKEVYCKPTTPPAGGFYMFYNNASGIKIYVPRNSVEAYEAANRWSDYASDIEGYDF